MLTPPSKWTIVVAFILAALLHATPVIWVELQQEKPPVEVVTGVIHSLKAMTPENGAGTDTGGQRPAGSDAQPLQ